MKPRIMKSNSRPSGSPSQPFSVFWFLVFMAAHAAIALAMYRWQVISTVHALATVALGFVFALSGNRTRVVYLAGYMVGAEVLWRMSNAAVFWEFGKYAVSAVFLLSLLRGGRLKGPVLPFLYFFLLILSSFLSVDALKWAIAQGALSFNLSGPFALMVSCWFFSQVRIKTEELYRLFYWMIVPIAGIAARAISRTYTAEDIRFADASNRVTSGGFGPNQVSSILGLGVM